MEGYSLWHDAGTAQLLPFSMLISSGVNKCSITEKEDRHAFLPRGAAVVLGEVGHRIVAMPPALPRELVKS